VRSIEELLE